MKKITILNLDDHRLFGMGFKLCLAGVDAIDHQWVSTPNEALQLLDEMLLHGKCPTCIITDYTHPGMTGIEFAIEAKKRCKEYEITVPIILLSMVIDRIVHTETANSVEVFYKNGDLPTAVRELKLNIVQAFRDNVFTCCLPKSIESSELIEHIFKLV